MTRRRATLLAGLAPAAFLAVFFAWPVASLLVRGLRSDGVLDVGAVVDVLGRPATHRVLAYTVRESLASTALTLVIGLPIAHVLSRYRFAGRDLAQALVVVPFVLPTVVVAAAFTGLLGPGSPLASVLPGGDLRGSVAAVAIAHAFFNVAVVVRTVGAVWERLDPALAEAAQVLGASRARAWAQVELPLLLPAIGAAAGITFLFSATSFVIVRVLGGAASATIEVEIWRTATQMVDLRTASALALVQLVAVLVVLVVGLRLEARSSRPVPMVDARRARRRPRGAERWWVGGVLTSAVVVLGAPVVVLVERSLWTGSGYGLGAWRSLGAPLRDSVLFVAPGTAIATSLRTACVATAVAVPLGLLAALALDRRAGRGRLGEGLLLLPLGTSAVTVGLGMLLAFSGSPLAWRSEPWLVPVAHAVVALPFVVRVVLPLLRGIDPAVREAAAVLGAGPWRVRREVDLPILGQAVVVAAGFAFAISLGEFGATTFLARADGPTVPLLIERLLAQPGASNVSAAMALSVVLASLVGASLLLAERVRPGRSGW